MFDAERRGRHSQTEFGNEKVRLKGIPPEEVFKQFSPDEVFKRFTPSEIEAYLLKLKKETH